MYKPVVLVVLDGWGLSNNVQGNPIREATLPTFEKLNRFYPMTTLQASGISVGLPWNTAGNSEVGHMTMGAGRVIYQNMPRISLSIQMEASSKMRRSSKVSTMPKNTRQPYTSWEASVPVLFTPIRITSSRYSNWQKMKL
jgi:bisphosphoglycerate-independent phosphoglycerate mutase (AlkP superfamily)